MATVHECLKDYKKAKAIIFSDYSEYEPSKSRNGGCYGFEVAFTKMPNANFWHREETTTGEFCPYCRRFECSGDCEEAEYYTSKHYTCRELLHSMHWFIEHGYTVELVF